MAAQIMSSEQWPALSGVAKMTRNPWRFLEECMPLASQDEDDTWVLVSRARYLISLRSAAEAMNLYEQTIFDPHSNQGDRLSVISHTRATLKRGITQIINGEIAPTKMPYKSLPDPDQYEKEMLEEYNKWGYWDVSGVWSIECPEISHRFGAEITTGFQLVIRMGYTEDYDSREICALFDLGVITGIMRFVRPSVSAAQNPEPLLQGDPYQQGYAEGYLKGIEDGHQKGRESLKKRKAIEISDDEDDEVAALENNYQKGRESLKKRKTVEISDNEDGGVAPIEISDDGDGDVAPLEDPNNIFEIGDYDDPSPERSTWSYRWRGRDAADGAIQLGSDESSSTIKFSGPAGTKLKGIFKCALFPECTFTGKKVGPQRAGEPFPDTEKEWKSMGRAAWDYARTLE